MELKDARSIVIPAGKQGEHANARNRTADKAHGSTQNS